MNRERLTILRDHLASLPDERVDMNDFGGARECGTVACIGGWASFLSEPERKVGSLIEGQYWLGLSDLQSDKLFWPNHVDSLESLSRQDAIAAIQSMLDSPDDDALPVWPEAGQ